MSTRDRDRSATATAPTAPHRSADATAQPLSHGVRAHMEARFGHDFSSVRVHADAHGDARTQALGADAYTQGSDVHFAADRYRPETPAGAELLAHELAHVVQQSSASAVLPRVSEPGEASEREADQAASAALHGGEARVSAGRSVPAVQRQRAQNAPPDFRLRPSPWFQRSMGRLVIDGFPTGKSTLTADQRDRISSHAGMLKTLLDSEAGGRVSITGHGDAVGTAARNLALGMERAQAVKAVLVAAGIASELIDLDSAGETQPAKPAPGAETQNRRAVIGYSPPLRLPGMPGLQPPTFDLAPTPKLDLGRTPPFKPKWDLKFPQTTLPPEPEKPGPRRDTSRDFNWKQAERMMERAREIERKLPKDNRSPVERFADAVAKALDPLVEALPISKELKDKVRDGIKKGVESGTEKGCEAAIDATGLTGSAADGAKAACKAALKSKPAGTER